MRSLSPENQTRLNAWLISDRQWKREHRIGYARRALMFAWATPEGAEQDEEVSFWRAVIKANEL